jgi:hypothetical protein
MKIEGNALKLISDGGKRKNEGVNPTSYIVSTDVNITSYPPVKLLCANRQEKKRRENCH